MFKPLLHESVIRKTSTWEHVFIDIFLIVFTTEIKILVLVGDLTLHVKDEEECKKGCKSQKREFKEMQVSWLK